MHSKELKGHVLVLGATNTGKSWLLHRFKRGAAPVELIYATIGSDLCRQKINVCDEVLDMHIWEYSYRFWRGLRYEEIKRSIAAIFLFDFTNMDSYHKMQEIVNDLLDVRPDIPLYIAGNKCDLPNRQVLSNEAEKYCRDLEARYFNTSAMTGEGVNDMFQVLARDFLLEQDNLLQSRASGIKKDQKRFNEENKHVKDNRKIVRDARKELSIFDCVKE